VIVAFDPAYIGLGFLLLLLAIIMIGGLVLGLDAATRPAGREEARLRGYTPDRLRPDPKLARANQERAKLGLPLLDRLP
jgi:hypothetical protein